MINEAKEKRRKLDLKGAKDARKAIDESKDNEGELNYKSRLLEAPYQHQESLSKKSDIENIKISIEEKRKELSELLNLNKNNTIIENNNIDPILEIITNVFKLKELPVVYIRKILSKYNIFLNDRAIIDIVQKAPNIFSIIHSGSYNVIKLK